MQPEILIFSSPISWRSDRRSALGDVLRDRDRARVGQRAVVQPGQAMMSVIRSDVGRREPDLRPAPPDRRQVVQLHMRQDQVLLVADPHLVQRIVRRRGRRRAPSARRWHRPAVCRSASARCDDGIARRLCGTRWSAPSGRRPDRRLGRSKARPDAPAGSRRRGAKKARCGRARRRRSTSMPRPDLLHSSSTWRANSSTPSSWTRILMRAL
jgi:hypothetical protein